MGNRRNIFYPVLITFMLLMGCNSYPKTPEEVVEQFVLALSKGHCEKAMSFCNNAAKESLQGTIDTGCEPYHTRIDSLKCEIDDTIARCTCYEYMEGLSIGYNYDLKLIHEKWTIVPLKKDEMDLTDMESDL